MTNETQTIDADALRAQLAEMAQRARDETEDASEVAYLDALLARQHAILTGVADALRGDPGPLASHSHHDLAERAASVVAVLGSASTPSKRPRPSGTPTRASTTSTRRGWRWPAPRCGRSWLRAETATA